MRLRRNVAVVMVTVVVATSFMGCSGSSDKKETEVVTTKETTNAESSDDFDFSQIFDNVEVNGKHIPFPFTLNDLGDGFEVRAVTEMRDGNCCGTLYYNDDMVAGVFMKIDSEDKFNNDTEIYNITLYSSDIQVFKIKGIDCNDNIEKLKSNIIGLDESYDANNVLVQIGKSNGNDTFIDFFVKDGNIRKIYLAKGE